MSAVSRSQQQMMAIAEKHPEKLYERNRGVLRMTKRQLHEYASTKHKGMPEHKRKSSRGLDRFRTRDDSKTR